MAGTAPTGTKLVELITRAREESHHDVQRLRTEFRQDLAALHAEMTGLLRKLVWGVVVLGLALGGKDVLEAVFG
jgi:hypothetical protein